jgi:hypothetical protein
MFDAITTAVGRGVVTPAEAASLAGVAEVYVRSIEGSEFERQVRALEIAHAAARGACGGRGEGPNGIAAGRLGGSAPALTAAGTG